MNKIVTKTINLVFILLLSLTLFGLNSATTGCSGLGGELTVGGEPLPPAAIDESSVLGQPPQQQIDQATLPEGPIDPSILQRNPVEAVIPPETVSCPKMQVPFGGRGLSILRGDPCDKFTAFNIETVFLYPEPFNKTVNKAADIIGTLRGDDEATERDKQIMGDILSKSKELDVCVIYDVASNERKTESLSKKLVVADESIAKRQTSLESEELPFSVVYIAVAKDGVNLLEAVSEGSTKKVQSLSSGIKVPESSTNEYFDIRENYFAFGDPKMVANISRSDLSTMEEALLNHFNKTPETNLVRSFERVSSNEDPDKDYETYGMIPEKVLEVEGRSFSSNNMCRETAVIINDESTLFERSVEVTELTSSAIDNIVNSIFTMPQSISSDADTRKTSAAPAEAVDEFRTVDESLLNAEKTRVLETESVLEEKERYEESEDLIEETPGEEQQSQELLQIVR